MTTILALYEKPIEPVPSWVPLLQQQALLAASRAILSDDRSAEPARSQHVLLVPANLDLLPLLTIAARDFATFAEPEAPERPVAPIVLYEDGSLEDMPDGMDEMELLFHPAWFQRPRSSLAETVTEHRPRVCVVLGDVRSIIVQRGELLRNVERIVYFEHLARSGLEGVPERLRGRLIAADGHLQGLIERARSEGEHPSPSTWDSMLREGEEFDLEPFVAFGPAIEMAMLSDDSD
jgi:hypothetical protein